MITLTVTGLEAEKLDSFSTNPTLLLTITPRGSWSIREDPRSSPKSKSLVEWGSSVAAGPGLEPGLSDSELVVSFI